MAFRKITRTTTEKIQTPGGELERSVEKEMLIFDLICTEDGCAKAGGTIEFTREQAEARGGEEALEADLRATYSHQCDDHNKK